MTGEGGERGCDRETSKGDGNRVSGDNKYVEIGELYCVLVPSPYAY